MTSLNAALNYPFSSPETLRQVFADRGADDAVVAQLKQAASNQPFQVGSTITARYQYKVAQDGSLVPTQTQITADHADEGVRQQGRRSRAFRDGSEEKRASLRDFTKPKAELSPADEVSLFATDAAGTDTTILQPAPGAESEIPPVAPIVSGRAEVLDENGETVEAEILNAAGQPLAAHTAVAQSGRIAQALASAANLYARNSTIAYTITPLALVAA